MWHWGGGWLATLGFHDFAGSTIVHVVGGCAALAGALTLGPRIGRFEGGEVFDPHNLPLAAIGALLLWFGWYGFNGGSVLSADPATVSLVVVTTTLAAAAGVVVAAGLSWGLRHKPDLGMALNGALAGLVGITAGADAVGPMAAVVIGAVSGALVYGATALLERLRVDDPVGAVPVHLVCGVWGTVAVALFSAEVALLPQLIGLGAVIALCFPLALGAMWALGRTLGWRVGPEEELGGLDRHEHDADAYSGFPVDPWVRAAK
jgi:Amt family ammonium transporter